MFAENPWKSFLYIVWVLFLLAVIAASNTLEFLHFFIARGENTLFELPVEQAAGGEFVVMLLFSLLALGSGLLLARATKGPSPSGYILCGLLVALALFKWFFYLPNLVFTGMPFWYILKQIPPILFTGAVGVFAFLKAADFKYQKYR